MSALFIPAGSFTVIAGSEQVSAPVANILNDHPAMVWRSTSSTASLTVTLTGGIDAIALWGTNLTASDTVRIRIGPQGNGQTPFYDETMAGKPNVLFILPAVITGQFLRIDITRTAGVVEVSRLLASKRIENEGISMLAENTIDDQSVRNAGPGWSSSERYPVLQSWKIMIDGVEEVEYFDVWHAFLNNAGQVGSFVFVPVYPHAYLSQSACYGRFDAPAKITWLTEVDRRIELVIGAIA